jgi:hypothetical protein
MIRALIRCSPCLATIVVAQAVEPPGILIGKRPFAVRHTVTAIALPEQVLHITLNPDAWGPDAVTFIATHGSRVSKGERLVTTNPDAIADKTSDLRRMIDARADEIALAELALRDLEQTAPHRLEQLKRAAADARDDLAHFGEIRRKAVAETAEHKLRAAELALADARGNDPPVNPPDHAGTRTQDARIKAAEFEWRMRKSELTRTLEVLLPREAARLADAARDAAHALTRFEQESPLAIARARSALALLKAAIGRDQRELAGLEAEQSRFPFTAPAEGWFHHGDIRNGTAESRHILGTFVPATSPIHLHAALDPDSARQLTPGAAGTAWFAGRKDNGFPVKLTRVDTAPDPHGRFTAVWSADWPSDPAVTPLACASIITISHQNPAAIVIPAAALRFDPPEWTVAVKLANGKTERRPVTRGRTSGGECEILAGLEPGQVIVP